jgi:TonB family protein
MRPLEAALFGYLLNSLWQIPLLFAAAWLSARALRRIGPAAEHRIWVTALFLEVLLPACSFRPSAAIQAVTHWLLPFTQASPNSDAQVTVVMGPAHAAPGLHLAHAWLTPLIVLYASSLLYFAARLALGLYQTASLRRRAKPITLFGYSAQSYSRYAQLFAVTNARIAASTEIASPVTLGLRRPLLLLPLNMDEAVLPEDLDAALAHEFAHMRRRDFGKNLAYQALSLPAAFHPFLWLTRRQIAATREILCDTIAAEAVSGSRRYARSLLRLTAQLSAQTPATPTQAIGIFDANHFHNFERRIMHLTKTPIALTGARRLATTAASLFLITGACASALAFRMQVAAPAPSPATDPAPSASPQASPQPYPQKVSFGFAVPRWPNTEPAQSFKANISPSEIADASGLSPVFKVLTPAVIEPSQDTQANPVHVSAGVMVGNALTKVQPIYPPEAKAARIQGTVLLAARIGKDGSIESLKLISGPPELTKSAWDAVKQWTYKPYLLNGEPTAVDTTITVNYSLEGSKAPEAAPPAPAPGPEPSASNGLAHPTLISAPNPEYPAKAREEKNMLNGNVEVSLTVGTDGLPRNVVVLKSLRPDFDQSALTAVRQYRFKPAVVNGNPVTANLTIQVNFQQF